MWHLDVLSLAVLPVPNPELFKKKCLEGFNLVNCKYETNLWPCDWKFEGELSAICLWWTLFGALKWSAAVSVCFGPPFTAEMNRHHYSLYVHNCRLVFLLRRDFTQVDTFRPAEFHWKLEQVRGFTGTCSGWQWGVSEKPADFVVHCLFSPSGFKVVLMWRSVSPHLESASHLKQ